MEDTVVEIPKGSGLSSISRKLMQSGVIANDKVFILYVMKEGWQDELKAGEYKFEKGSTMADVTNKIVRGDVELKQVTIPEGLTVKEIARLLDEKGVVSEADFIKETQNKVLIKQLLGPDLNSFEGYLFPETYSYSRSLTPKELIVLMVERFKAVYEPLSDQRERVNLTDNEILTLASIIEKETGSVFERPVISAVFQNRLRIGMKLDSDPTVIYGMGENYNGNLRRRDLKEYTKYNTYVIKGLPPGPIANPGRDSIIAVLDPADVKYLYFVSKGDGTHHFSNSFREHQNAVNKYQR
ncbi:MAG: aminodeoxychorismate lyase [Thermodesulfobacteriota bacterium]|nr:MAG: aminodeoxychorismate lyase [Thermodesulfobacteriota bacterium]